MPQRKKDLSKVTRKASAPPMGPVVDMGIPLPLPEPRPLPVDTFDEAPYPTESIQQAYAPFVSGAEPPPDLTQHSGGFKSRLKDALIGGVLAGPSGALAGLVHPQFTHQLRYNMVDLPRYMQRTQFQEELKKGQLGRLENISQMTGIEPLTGLPTLASRQADALNQYRITGRELQKEAIDLRERLGTTSAELQGLRFNQQQQNQFNLQKQREFNALMKYYIAGGTLGPAEYQKLAELNQPTNIPPKYDPKAVFIAQDAYGNVTGFAIGTRTSRGETVPLGPGGRPSPETAPPSEFRLMTEAQDLVWKKMVAEGKITKQDEKAGRLALLLGRRTGVQVDWTEFDRRVDEEMRGMKKKVQHPLQGKRGLAPPAQTTIQRGGKTYYYHGTDPSTGEYIYRTTPPPTR